MSDIGEYMVDSSGPHYDHGFSECQLKISFTPRSSGLVVPEELLVVRGRCVDVRVGTGMGITAIKGDVAMDPQADGLPLLGKRYKAQAFYGALGTVQFYLGFKDAHAEVAPQPLNPMPEDLSTAFQEAGVYIPAGDWAEPPGTLYL